MRPGLRPLPLLALLFALAACEGGPEPDRPSPEGAPEREIDPVRVVDHADRTWVLEHPPRRVISLVPAATEILLALGMEDRLVARTDFDRAPALAALPSVGGGLNPSLERLVGADPDLVIRFEGPTDLDTPRTLDRMGVPHLAVRPDTVGDIHRMIELLAEAMRVPDRGADLRRRIQEDLEAVRRSVAGMDAPRVVFLLGGDPPWVAGPGTFLHELVEIAGGNNVFGNGTPLYAPVSVEEVVRRAPEILLATEGARIPAALRRIPVKRVPESVQRPGVEVGSSAATLARILHPEWPR